MNNLDPKYAHLPTPTSKKQSGTSVKKWIRLVGLQLIGQLLKWRHQSSQSNKCLDKILLIRPDHLGDLLFLTPALRYLRNLLPEAHLTLMAGPWAKAIVEKNPHIDQILLCEFPGFTRRHKLSLWQPYQYLQAQAQQLATHQFDQAIILRFDHWWGAWLATIAGIPQRYGYNLPEVAPFLTNPLPYQNQRHEVEQNWRLIHFAWSRGSLPIVDWWSEPDIIGPLQFFPRQTDEAWATNWLRNHNISTHKPVIIIHPGAGAAVKAWRPEAWIELGQTLINAHHCHLILSGGPTEIDLTQTIASQITPVPAIATGKTSLSQLAALMAQADLVIGPDTGPLKLAAAMRVPTLQLYGPVDAQKFGPWGNEDKHQIITSGLSCLPCNRLDYADTEVKQHFCIAGLSVEAVLKKAVTLLNSKMPEVT